VADIYQGKHDLPRANWDEFRNATGEQIELETASSAGGSGAKWYEFWK